MLLTPQQARTVRRTVTDENAENVASTRLTRAKAAALTDGAVGEPPKKALATKALTRKRPALENISNIAKKDPSDAGKDTLGKTALSKAAKPAGIQKAQARTTTTRTVLGQKASNTTTSDTKRPASGSGVNVQIAKKRNTSATKPKRPVEVEVEEEDASENVPPTKASVKPAELKAHVKPDMAHVDLFDIEDDEAKTFEELIKEAKDLDSEDLGDPSMVAEYVHEIFDYLKQVEMTTLPNADYMDKQPELEWNMRGILVDWLLEVHARFRLLPETLFLAVNIVDRFLSSKVVQLDRLQLVGITAMFIASKYEEVMSPHVSNFVHVADEGFKDSEILSAERFILTTLDYDLSYPNPMNFLRRISKADNYDIQTRTLGKYLLEIGCLDHRFMKYPPSQIAAAAMYLARLALNRGEWDATLTKYAGYTEAEIEPIFKLMVNYLASDVVHEAFFKKYASKKFLKGIVA
jgi:G2/mitotic-specific cyclin 1/2